MTNADWAGYESGSQNQPFSPTGQYPAYGYQSQFGSYPDGAAPQYGTYREDAAPQYGTYPGDAGPQYRTYPGDVAPQYGMHPRYPGPQYGAWQAALPEYRSLIIGAIVGGVLCSLLIGMPLGLIAQRKSRRVRDLALTGDYDGAAQASRSARTWAIAAIVFDVLGLILAIVVLSHAGQPTG